MRGIAAGILVLALASACVAADNATVKPPAGDNATVKPASPDNATVKRGKVATTPRIVLVENETIRVMGYKPREFLWISIWAIVAFNVIGLAVVAWYIRKVNRREAEEEAKEQQKGKSDVPV